MRLMKDRRGATAVLFALSAIPLIGLAGLGTEVGAWYTVKRHAQNAADAAALAGAITLVSNTSSGAASAASARATSLATADGFTNAASPFAGATQSVSFSQTATSVTATISQTQPMLLAPVLCIGRSNCSLNSVTISATATASIVSAQPVCMLALSTVIGTGSHAPLILGGSQTITGTGCSIMSDGNVELNGSLSGLNGGSVLAAKGCLGQACTSLGAPSNWYAPPPNNPLTRLDDRSQFPLPSLPGATTISTSNSNNDYYCPTQSSGKYKNACPTNPLVLQSANYRDLFAAPTGTMTLNGGTINSVNAQGGSLALNAGTYNIQTLSLQSGNFTQNSGGTYNVGSVSVTGGAFTILPGTYNTISVSGGSLTLSAGTYHLNSVSVSGGTLTLPGGTSYISNVSVSGGTLTLKTGTYYLGTVSITGGTVNDDATVSVGAGGTTTVTGGENLVIETSLNVNNATINLTAHTDTSSLLNGVLIYDPQSGSLNFTGNSTSTFGGALYFPNADLTWGGNSSATMQCTEIIAYTLTFQGNTYIDASKCPDGSNGIVPKAQTVLLTN